MWLRDSANQLQSYVSLLRPPPATSRPATTTTPPPPPSKLASLFRGAINLQTRYLLAAPHCNAFQPPAEAAMAPGNDGNRHDLVFPPYDPAVVFECKYELDSLAAFLQLSWDYYHRTKDARFFVDASSSPSSRRGRGRAGGWKAAVVAILDTAEAMRAATYTPAGMVLDSPYRFERFSSVPTETLGNRGNGSPVRAGTGMVRSAFRPSDDSTTFQLLVPANMMLAKYLELCSEIVAGVEREEARSVVVGKGAAQGVLDGEEEQQEEEEEQGDGEMVAERMKRMAKEIQKGIEKFGKVKHPEFGEIYAYETDGYMSTSMMVSWFVVIFMFKRMYILLTLPTPPGRRQPPFASLGPSHRLPLPQRPNLPRHAQIPPLARQPLLRPRARPQRHRRAAHWPGHGVAHEPGRGHHDDRRRRRDQGPAAPAAVVDRLSRPDARERQRAQPGHVDAQLVQLGQRPVWPDDAGLARAEAAYSEDELPARGW